MMTSLKVLTLNVWGVFTPLVCPYRKERIDAIGREISKADYDIVLLQEVWTQADYNKLCAQLLTVLSHTHYFHSGMFGCGVCIFSKHPIIETLLHPFTLNGYAHKVYHGDWFCGKGVGLAKVMVNNIKLHVYATHLHACYNEVTDEYRAHRISQAFELSQFVKNTSETCDVVILGGDCNFMPTDLGYKVVHYNGNLMDSWINQKHVPEEKYGGTTCDRPDNSFTPKNCLKDFPDGKRLDYLWFRSNAGFATTCEKCDVVMQEMPGKNYHYSDHEGVEATYTIKKNITAMAPSREAAEVEKHLGDCLPLLEQGMRKVHADQAFYAIVFFLSLVAIVFTADVGMSWTVLGAAVGTFRTVLTIVMAACIWLMVVMANREINGILGTKKNINNILRSNPIQ